MLIRLTLVLYCVYGSLAQSNKNRNIDYSDCGKRYTKEVTQEVGSYSSEVGHFPWHVGIYKYDRFLQNYENICGGTIISSHIVITAANCVFDTSNKTAIKPTFFKVTAGKLAYDWTTPDSNAQEVNVNDIAIPDTYLGDINSYSENIAVLNLAKDLYFNDIVLPICLDLNNKRNDAPKRMVQTAGWGLKGDVKFSPILKEATLQYINIVECRKRYSSIRYLRFINYDKVCLLTPHGRRDHDAGGGLVYKKGDKYHLLGVISAYINNDFSPSTNVSKHLDWVRQTVNTFDEKKRCLDGFNCLSGGCIEEELVCDGTLHCPDGSDESYETCPLNSRDTPNIKGSCILPIQRGGVSYTKLNCKTNCEVKGGSQVLPNEKVQMNCGKGFAAKDSEGMARFVCTSGTWFPEDPACIKLCSGLKKENLNFECTYKNSRVNCDTFMRPDTVARYNCDSHYTINDPIAFSGITTCLNGGKWKEDLPNCVAECGVENPIHKATPTIAHGTKSVYGKYPWHMGIYKMSSYNTSYINICGGSLIHTNFILTAAHCMFEPNSNIKFKESDLVVAGGKFLRDWYKHEEHQQSSRVKKIIAPETYAGFHTRYEQDIALLYTETSFKFNDFVLPVCLDRTRPIVFPPNALATIVGWGFTEQEVYSDVLKEVKLPIISTLACRTKYKDFIEFITSDKFCAIYINGSGTQVGDSGGGLTISRAGRHYIHGIVSVKKTNANEFAAFTNVSLHLEWIQRVMKSYVIG